MEIHRVVLVSQSNWYLELFSLLWGEKLEYPGKSLGVGTRTNKKLILPMMKSL